jgi:hypothetical protein
LVNQAKKSTGFYCRLYRRVDEKLMAADTTLKHLKIDNDQVVVKFDRDYVVGTVQA